MLTVTNRNGFVFKSRYNGIDLEFPVNEKVLIDPDAASHIFGFGANDEARANAITRNAWAHTNADMPAGRAILANFVFIDSSEALPDEPVADVVDPVFEGPSDPIAEGPTDDIPTFASKGKRQKT